MLQYQSMRILLAHISRIIATVFFIGYIPFAPGTFGSLAALAVVWVFKPDTIQLLIILIVSFLAGTLSSHIVEKDLVSKDSSFIVIDEFVGYLFAILFLPLDIGYVIAAFILFRFFDILKPPPIRNVEKFRGAIGIMMDDVLAGIFTNIILHAWKLVVG